MKTFLVKFSRIGNIGQGYSRMFKARTVEALEPEINSFVTGALNKEPDQITVTVDPDNMIGQLDYGLLGNFTITLVG